ncbi:hypothetical protein PV328_003445 [Microctonus aethiopoides]|uniref:Uncharacterized protein n=1 Tax=Microctonus aethiopoides TaxID=144406 RepID=A0AA39F8K2_9HYME|nr:hypothetical protein PV328_003445 [Microctonus aethiopoides]
MASDMKNLGSRWTGPNIPRTAVARSLLVVAISPKDIGRRIRHKIIRDKHQTRRRSIVVAVGDKIDCENTRSNVVQQPHLSVRFYKTSLYTTAHSKFKKHIIANDISISRLQLQLHYRHRQFYYSSSKTHSRHFRKC